MSLWGVPLPSHRSKSWRPALVCAAAYRLFSTKGYLATSIEDIAAEAGVARPTVFSAVGPKPVILRAVVDGPSPVTTRRCRSLSAPGGAKRSTNPTRSGPPSCTRGSTCRNSGRAGLVLRALETAASIDADAAEVWARFQHQRRVGLNEFAVSLAQKTSALRYDEKAITDTMWMWMLAPDAYLRLVHDAGWPVEQFQAWLADLLQRMLLE